MRTRVRLGVTDGAIDVTSAAVGKAPGDRLSKVAELSDGELPLVGDLRWSDSALGWVVTWSIEARGRRYRWSVRGINYDEAFRTAVRGAARVLSGNGEP